MYNPLDICDYIKTRLTEEESIISLVPWYRGFKGKIESTSSSSFITRGICKIVKNNTINVTELPIGVWTEKYIEMLEKHLIDRSNKESAKYYIRDIIDNSTEDSVNILIKLNPYTISSWKNKIGKDGISVLENKLKLTSTLSTSNIYAFDENLQIKKYTVDNILNEWFNVRKGVYVNRRKIMLEKLKKELDIIKYKTRFITEIVDDVRIINKKPKAVIIQELLDSDYPKFNKSYDYLLKMDLYKLTYEEIESLKNKCDMKQLDYDTLEAQTAGELWGVDIDRFIQKWTSDLKEYNKLHDVVKQRKRLKIKKTK
tara:strand:- start:381 stop:1319 length:939 start_codon:yes stop_codon:yes gene_type:complete